MLITKKSILTGRERTFEIDVTPEELDRWEGGDLIQNVMPHLSAEEREFLMTGITNDEWKYLAQEEASK